MTDVMYDLGNLGTAVAREVITPTTAKGITAANLVDSDNLNGSSLRGWDRGGLGEAILDPRPLQQQRPMLPTTPRKWKHRLCCFCCVTKIPLTAETVSTQTEQATH